MIKTVLVPGVAWPKYRPSDPVNKMHPRRRRNSVSGLVQAYVETHPNCTLHEVVDALSVDAPKHTIAVALERLWANNRISGELKLVNGRRMRHYVIGPNA